MFPTGRIHGPENQRVEVEMAPFILTPCKPFVEFLQTFSAKLGSGGLEVLGARGDCFHQVM